MIQMEDEDINFKLLKKKVFENGGFDTEPYSEKFIKRKFANRMRLNNIDSYKEYAEFLEENPVEYSKLIDTITIPVTEFFRDPEVWEDLETKVIPELIAKKEGKNQKIIRIWSAGCASGEETYSIAMSMREVLDRKFEGFKVSIYGTDIDKEALNKAREGIYEDEKVENIPEDYLEKYFINKEEGYKANKYLKSIVKFKNHNLISGDELTSFDIIFCRNILIYFSRETHEKIHMKLYKSLSDSGYLIIGKTELLHGKARKKFERFTDNKIYKKPSEFFN